MKREQLKKLVTELAESIGAIYEASGWVGTPENEKLYDDVLEDGRIDDYITDVLGVDGGNQKEFSDAQAKYAGAVVELVSEHDFDFDEAIEHVTSKDWEQYREEILDKAMEDDFDTDTAIEIADAVADPASGIEYGEYVADLRS